uniref:Ribonuclease H2 subunit C-like protein n=1 Tax=Callorhinchus milii TaxID=7868 RepID=V9LH85_CALMI
MAASGSVPHVRVDLSSLSNAPKEKLHLLPVRIECDGAAKVSQYFTPSIRREDESGGVTSSFRGRCLHGLDLDVPEGYIGMVLKEEAKPCAEDEERVVRVKSTFSALTCWNLETPPRPDDSAVKAMNWPTVAEAVHAPV